MKTFVRFPRAKYKTLSRKLSPLYLWILLCSNQHQSIYRSCPVRSSLLRLCVLTPDLCVFPGRPDIVRDLTLDYPGGFSDAEVCLATISMAHKSFAFTCQDQLRPRFPTFRSYICPS